jgi:hypothetical protein
MKMIRHQTISIGTGNREDILSVFFQKIPVILIIPKNIFKTIGMIENMIARVWL